MSEQELQELREYIERTRAARTASMEVAREQLIREGIITPEGKLTKEYGGTAA